MCCIILQICKCLNEWNSTVPENYNEIRSVQIKQYLDFCELFQRKKDSCTQGIIFQFLGNGNVAHLSDNAFHLWALQNYLFHIAFTFSLINLNGVLIYLEIILCVCSLVFFFLSEQCTHWFLKYLFSCLQILDQIRSLFWSSMTGSIRVMDQSSQQNGKTCEI